MRGIESESELERYAQLEDIEPVTGDLTGDTGASEGSLGATIGRRAQKYGEIDCQSAAVHTM